jgi:hypothetical protein
MKMKMKIMALGPAVLASAVVLIASPASAAGGQVGFGFNAPDITGHIPVPFGAVSLSGGGSYDPGTGFAEAGGGFRCTSDIIFPGPLVGCLAGQGVRWHAVALELSTTFKCSGSAAEPLKTATTGNDTVVLNAAFYRAGDGNVSSFPTAAEMIVSAHDIASDIPGIQNVWIRGVGCAQARAVHFSS